MLATDGVIVAPPTSFPDADNERLSVSRHMDGNHHLRVEDDPVLHLDAGTVRFYFKTNQPHARQGLFAKDHVNIVEDGHIHVEIFNGRVQTRLQQAASLGGNQRTLTSTSFVVSGQWHEVTVSFGPAGYYLYVDRALEASDKTFTQDLSRNVEVLVIGATNHKDADGAVRFKFQGDMVYVTKLF